MAMTEQAEGAMRISGQGGSRTGCLGRGCMTVLLLCAIGLATVFWGAGSKGGADLVKSALQKHLGEDLRLSRTGIGWPFDLVIEQLATLDTTPQNEPLFKADEVRLSLWRFWRPAVLIRRGELNLLNAADGSWQPACFQRLGDLPVQRVAYLSGLTSRLRRRLRLKVLDGNVRWVQADGEVYASASGITFRMEPVVVPNQRMTYYYLSAYNVTAPTGDRVHDVVREWLASEEKDYLELSRSGRPADAVERGFWDVTGLVQPPPVTQPETGGAQ